MGESTGQPAWATRSYGPGSAQLDASSGRLLRVSSSLCRLLGYSESELLQRRLPDLALPEDRTSARATWRSLFEGDTDEITLEMRCAHKDGSARLVRITGTSVREAREQPYRVAVFVEDVTELDRAERRALAAERALAESETRAKTVFYSDIAPMSYWKPDGRITEANDAYLQLVGYTQEELRAGLVRWDDLTLPEERGGDDRAMAELASGQRRCTPYKKEYVRRDGTRVPVLLSGCLLPGGRSEDGGVALALDITELRRAEEALRESERQLRAALGEARQALAERERLEAELRRSERQLASLIANSPDAIYRLDLDLRCMFMSATSTTVIGLPPEHCVGKTPRENGFPPDVSEAGEAACREAVATGKPQRMEFSVGERRYRARIIPELGPDGAVESFLGICEDVTTERLAEEERQKLLESERAARDEAERVSRVKDDFVATLSHELRAPINAILGWARILRSRAPDAQALARGLEVIERNARLQADMVSELLDMSRIISGKMRLDVQRVDLPVVIQSAIESIKLAAEVKGLTVASSVDPEAISLKGDPARLQQVVWNLLSNAAKFTPSGGRIDIALRRDGAFAEVSVTDTGAGIAPQFLPYVFERFRQADASSTRKYGGLGIGLSIVKHLVELHGGTVEVASPGEGQGTAFTVRLPLAGVSQQEPDAAQRPGAARAEALADCPAAELTGVRVLVVDDQPDAREVAQRVLEECGASVTTAESAAEALAALERERPDVLVSDLGMPCEDGFQLIRRVRGLDPARGGATPAVALSALARAEDKARALGAGYQAHVAKPLDPAVLVGVIAALVRGRTGG
ncbi:PAS domain S-box protein [Sorangium sp. So ce321]|uniref:PAS domain S-box protein n=1 Tax=Sorangium sp. So ce321 TaxID=3133300 RepID=UPI003F60C719